MSSNKVVGVSTNPLHSADRLRHFSFLCCAAHFGDVSPCLLLLAWGIESGVFLQDDVGGSVSNLFLPDTNCRHQHVAVQAGHAAVW